ncbi:MAG: hypothetical protein Q9227_004942 [Pyrenula ochraceoflavens]
MVPKDRSNGLIMGASIGCQNEHLHPAAQTYTTSRYSDGSGPGDGHARTEHSQQSPAAVATTTICNRQLRSRLHEFPHNPTDIVVAAMHNFNQNKLMIDAFGNITSIVMLHEFFKYPPWSKTEVAVGFGVEANGWLFVKSLDRTDAFSNADSYAYLGLVSRLADSGFRLVPDPDFELIPELYYNGHLEYDADIVAQEL